MIPEYDPAVCKYCSAEYCGIPDMCARVEAEEELKFEHEDCSVFAFLGKLLEEE